MVRVEVLPGGDEESTTPRFDQVRVESFVREPETMLDDHEGLCSALEVGARTMQREFGRFVHVDDLGLITVDRDV